MESNYQVSFRNLRKAEEIQANKSVCISLLLLVLSILITLGLSLTGKAFFVLSTIDKAFLLAAMVVYLGACAVTAINRFEKPADKIILLGGLILGGLLIFCVEGFESHAYFLLPFFMVAFYASERLCVKVLIVSFIGITLNTFVFALIDINYLHYYNIEWTFSSIFFQVWFPTVIFLFISSNISFYLIRSAAKMGHLLIEIGEEQAKEDLELKLGAKLQMNSFPSNFQIAPNREFDLFAGIIPAKLAAGDFFDFFLTKDNHLVLLIADVSDKGLPAALYMMSARNTIRSLFSVMDKPEEICAIANDVLCQTSNAAFVTMFLLYIDIDSGRGCYINAGHPFPVIFHTDGTFGQLESEPEMVMGAFEGTKYTSKPIFMEIGDTLLLYTDGISEAMNSDKVTYEHNFIKKAPNLMSLPFASEIGGAVFNDITSFADDDLHSDDRTLAVLKWKTEQNTVRNSGEWDVSFSSITECTDMLNDVLERVNCPEETLQLIDTAIDEILSNIIIHSGASQIKVAVRAGKGWTRITCYDDGERFNYRKAKPQQRDILDIGGLGIKLVKSIMDEISYDYQNGNVNTFTKYWDPDKK